MLTREEHLLICLMEECAEVAQRVSKALRFGLTEVQNGQPATNAERVVEELLDLYGIVELLEESGALQTPSLRAQRLAIEAKRAKVERYLRYAESCGTTRSEASS